MRRLIAILMCACFCASMGVGCTQASKKPVIPDQKPNTPMNQKTSLTASEERVMASRFSTIANNVEGVNSSTVVVDTANTTGTVATPNEMVRNNNNTVNTQSPVVEDNKRTSGVGTTGTTTNPTVPGPTMKPGPSVVRTNDIVAMVGVTLKDVSMGEGKEATIKQTIKQRIMDSDKRVSEVLVTTDANMIKKIRDVASGVLEGKPTSSYAKDVNELNTMLRGK